MVQPDVKRVMSTVVDHMARADMTKAGVERAMTAEVRNGMPGGMAAADVPETMPAAVSGGMAAADVPETMPAAVPGGMAAADVPETMPAAVPGGMAATDVTATVTATMPATVTTTMPATVLSDRWETQQTDHGESDHHGHARACLHSHAHVWPPISTPAGTAEAPTKSAGAYIYIIDTARQQIFRPRMVSIFSLFIS
ncbi:MAG: hypothetical protein IH891_04860 [Planctomycetes bacterium]|nr:hypothetical protein [Planctomycetota bacterium]